MQSHSNVMGLGQIIGMGGTLHPKVQPLGLERDTDGPPPPPPLVRAGQTHKGGGGGGGGGAGSRGLESDLLGELNEEPVKAQMGGQILKVSPLKDKN